MVTHLAVSDIVTLSDLPTAGHRTRFSYHILSFVKSRFVAWAAAYSFSSFNCAGIENPSFSCSLDETRA
jgi:hypothetical protein